MTTVVLSAASPLLPGLQELSPVPELETYVLIFAGLAAVGFVARRRRQ